MILPGNTNCSYIYFTLSAYGAENASGVSGFLLLIIKVPGWVSRRSLVASSKPIIPPYLMLILMKNSKFRPHTIFITSHFTYQGWPSNRSADTGWFSLPEAAEGVTGCGSSSPELTFSSKILYIFSSVVHGREEFKHWLWKAFPHFLHV